LNTIFKLFLVPALFWLALPAYARQDEPIPNDSSSDSLESALEVKLWTAQRILESGDLKEAERLYREILAKQSDEPRALLGLARVYKRMTVRDGVYPPGMHDLMHKLQSIIDQQGKGVDRMLSRLRGQSAAQRAMPGSPRDEQMERSARKELERHYSQREKSEYPFAYGRALLFRRECLEPIYKDWYFLDPPS
jgi:hypothetical protein